ncbi:MAG: hypothetical protein WBC71_14615 [Salaquimonas sp.]
MRAFLMAMVVILIVALGAGFLMGGVLGESSSDAYTSTSTRL